MASPAKHWKICSSCKRTLPLRRFTKDASKQDGVASSCSWCLALRRARRRAVRSGVPFTITLDDLPWPLPERCPILPWIRLAVGSDDPNSSPSLDRIVPERGYVPSNIRWISQRANTLKRDATARELIALGRDGAQIEAVEEAIREEEKP